LARRTLSVLAVLALSLLAASVADGRSSTASACGARDYSYAGLQSDSKAHGVGATLVPLHTPTVSAGHVGAWIGVGGVNLGPNGSAEWLQVGFSAFPSDRMSRIYYEVTVPGSDPRYVELDSSVKAGEKHSFKVLEMANRKAWWRIWLDGKPVSPAIHLPGSHDAWYPQAMAESWNGGVRACNSYQYRFSNVTQAHADGGDWRPVTRSVSFHDAGYRFVQTSRIPSSFLATSLDVARPVGTTVPARVRRASANLAALQTLQFTRSRGR
jgi:hypothetical protein